jgi:phi13 family phage major tail protein
MATIGLCDLYRASITEDADGNIVFGTPKEFAKPIEVDLSPELAEATLYAGDTVDDHVTEFVGGEIKINMNDLTPFERAALLGQTQDETDGTVFANSKDDAPYYAIGFRARMPKGFYAYVWVHKVKFSIPDEKYQTKGDKIEYTTPELSGKVVTLPSGDWHAINVLKPTDAVAQSWFNSVRVRTAA